MGAKPKGDHKARRQEIEDWLDEKGVRWTFHFDVPTSKFDLDKSLRNQARITQVLNQTQVETYVEAIKRGDVFPAVIAYEYGTKYVVIDGNHRLVSHQTADRPLAMYLVDKDTDPATIILMTYEANTKHGLPTSQEERVRHAVFLMESAGATQESAAAALNLTKAQVTRAWLRHKADQRAADAGLRPLEWDALNVSVKQRLGSVRTDEGFSALADLAIRAGLTQPEVEAAVVQVNQERSAAGQKKKVEEMREMYRPRIQKSGGGTLKSAHIVGPKRHLLFGLGHLTTAADKAEQIIPLIAEAEIDDMVARVEKTAEFLMEFASTLRESKKEK